MIAAGCQERLDQMRRHFVWLYEEYRFSLVFSEGDSSLYCRFVLQSNDCRFRIDFDRGGFSIDLAMVPVSLAAQTSIAGLRWYSIEEVLDFWQRGLQANSKVEDEFRLTGLSLDRKLALVSEEYRPLWPGVMRLFSQTEFESRQEDLERFCQKRNEERERQHVEWLRRAQ
jgi:hypothetical protein